MRLVYLQGEGIPKAYCYGNNKSHNFLIEELLGKSLGDIFNSYGKPFSLKTVCVLGIEMLKRIQFIHQKYYIHCDINPDNFMTGLGENEKNIYLIDFGLAKKYYSIPKAKHINFSTGNHLIGTARYCSRNAHRGYQQSRRDDIESIGYVLMYFLLGLLPWQGLKIKKNEDQFEKIAEKKYNTPFEELTKGQPEEFLLFFKYVDGLKFEDQPNYVYIIGLFQTMIDKYCRECFYDFDWKKDSCAYISRDLKENQVVDASFVMNKNNDASGMDYSYKGDVEEENENNQRKNNNRNNIIKDKDIFVGEDQEQTKEESKVKESGKKNNEKNNDNSNNNSDYNNKINEEKSKRVNYIESHINNSKNNNIYNIENDTSKKIIQNYTHQQINNNNNINQIDNLKRKLKKQKDINQKLINENKDLKEANNKLNLELNKIKSLKEKLENDLAFKNIETQKILT